MPNHGSSRASALAIPHCTVSSSSSATGTVIPLSAVAIQPAHPLRPPLLPLPASPQAPWGPELPVARLSSPQPRLAVRPDLQQVTTWPTTITESHLLSDHSLRPPFLVVGPTFPGHPLIVGPTPSSVPSCQTSATTQGTDTLIHSGHPPRLPCLVANHNSQPQQPPFLCDPGSYPLHLQQTAMAVLQVLAGAPISPLQAYSTPHQPFHLPQPFYPPSIQPVANLEAAATNPRPDVCRNASLVRPAQDPDQPLAISGQTSSATIPSHYSTLANSKFPLSHPPRAVHSGPTLRRASSDTNLYSSNNSPTSIAGPITNTSVSTQTVTPLTGPLTAQTQDPGSLTLTEPPGPPLSHPTSPSLSSAWSKPIL